MPSCCSSHTVRRAPCSHGRVSPANTRAMRPWATPARITPNAVPKPAVASEPVLQWVSTPLPGAIRAAPRSPMCRLAARSSSAIACASSASTCRQSLPAAASARRMRASAHARLTAVGRAALSRAIAGIDLARGQHHAPGRGDADRRRATHGERMDGGGDRITVTAQHVLDDERQSALVQQLQGVAGPADRADVVVTGVVDGVVVVHRAIVRAAVNRRKTRRGSPCPPRCRRGPSPSCVLPRRPRWTTA